MKNAIILHGLTPENEYYDEALPSSSNCHWLPWLQKQLLMKGIKADTPEVQNVYEMRLEDYVKEVERFDINPETILIGHSMGGGFWIRYLSEHPELDVSKIILVAPWLNVNHEEDTAIFDFEMNPEVIAQAQQFTIFASDNDKSDVQNSVNFLRNELPHAKYKEFHNYGHFCYKDMHTDAFPELLEEIVSK
jgi:predicted alpha/beta hydrolase family esterase